MRLTNVFGGRPASYDRNPLVVSKQFDGVIGPATSTTRFTYTVPTARKLQETLAQVNIDRQTVATTAALVEGFVRHFQGTTQSDLSASFIGNVVDSGQRGQIGGARVGLAGDVFSGITFDGSTAGTVEFGLNWEGVEFDA